MAKASTNSNRPAKLTVFNTLGYIYKENGIRGLYRGVTPRIALGIWQTICMVSLADYVKAWYVALQVDASLTHPPFHLQGQEPREVDATRLKTSLNDVHKHA